MMRPGNGNGWDAEAYQMRGGSDAAARKQHISGLVGRLASDVEQYVRLRTATFVIGKAIERYRDRNQGPVLERASRIFARLTCGSFGSLRLENQEGEATLVGIRTEGQIVPLTGMSDGTLDQLYLALRIASLEHYFSAHDASPFVVDDVLLNFDDDRAAAALSALACSHTTNGSWNWRAHTPGPQSRRFEAGACVGASHARIA